MNAPATHLDMCSAAEIFRQTPDDFIEVEKGALAYRKVGKGPDVLFVHGWPVSGATYRRLIPFLSQHVTCHFIDLVGAGNSRFENDSDISVAKSIEHVRHVVNHLNLNDVSLVGHDSGGMIARYAMAGDKRLRSMAMLDTEQPQGMSREFKQVVMMRHIPGIEHILAWAIMKPKLRNHPLILGGCFTDLSLLDGEFEEFFLAPINKDRKRRRGVGAFLKSFEMHYMDNLHKTHRDIKVPVKWVCGEDDPFFPLEWSKGIVDTFENASVHVVPGVKLFAHEEKPQEVAEAILPTLMGR